MTNEEPLRKVECHISNLQGQKPETQLHAQILTEMWEGDSEHGVEAALQ